MEDFDFSDLHAEGGSLGMALGTAAGMAASFRAELSHLSRGLTSTGQSAGRLERGLSRGLQRAFTDLVVDGDGLSDVLEGLGRSMIRNTYNAALRPVADQAGSALASGLSGLVGAILPFADGAAFSAGRVVPFAQGGVVNGPTHFPMRGGVGLMGEAGPEAILPLVRGADGALGVRSSGRAAPTVVMNITTPDVGGFARARGQIASQMSRALSRGHRNR